MGFHCDTPRGEPVIFSRFLRTSAQEQRVPIVLIHVNDWQINKIDFIAFDVSLDIMKDSMEAIS